MPNLHKIDPLIYNNVKACSLNKKLDCLVWIKDGFCFNNVEDYHFYPFIKAFKLNATYSKILGLSDDEHITYISSVRHASINMNNVCSQVDCQTLFNSNKQGENVCVAVIDTGCAMHPDLVLGKNRIVHFVDFVNNKIKPYDDNGHGTFVCGVIAGNGLLSNSKYHGIAPKCNLIVLKALNSEGETQVFTILDAMQWIVDNKEKFNIKVVCMSFGSEPLEVNDPLKIGAEVLWDEGIVVVCASGNDGESIIGVKSPAISSKIITVGACFYNKGTYNVAPFSSFGEVDGVGRPDLVAPGVNVTSLSAGTECYTKMSGTSVSTPVVVGAVCLMLEHSPQLSPNKIKFLLLENTTSQESLEKQKTGAGLLNVANTISSI